MKKYLEISTIVGLIIIAIILKGTVWTLIVTGMVFLMVILVMIGAIVVMTLDDKFEEREAKKKHERKSWFYSVKNGEEKEDKKLNNN